MADSKEFNVIRIARSDGADTGPGYWVTTAPNTATSNAAAAKKGAKDPATAEKPTRSKPQMVRLPEDDSRFVEWRVKLGIILKQELSPNPEEGNAWYVQFPRGYWLYEKSKHLWVSGYPVKAKLFKSPQEFAVHVIWLLSASQDYKDCCCVHCNPPTIPKSLPAGDSQNGQANDTPTKAEKMPHKVTPVPLPAIPGQPPAKPIQMPASPAKAKAEASPVSNVLLPKVQPQAAQTQPAPQAQPMVSSQSPMPDPTQAQPLARAQAFAQAHMQPKQQVPPMKWTLQSSLLFRSGELVWYQNGATWRLGVVAVANPTGGFEVVPIGHSLASHPNVVKMERDMRPFYAFSVPPVTLPELKDKIFDEVPWEAMFQAIANDNARRDVLALDASKMAASKIDYSYSLWSPMSEDPNSKTTAYYGCFLGAERVEVGDCMRLKALPSELNVTADAAILGLQYIFTSVDYPGSVFFRGPVFAPAKQDSPPDSIIPEEYLPIALLEESRWRTQINPAQTPRWRLAKDNVTVKEQYIRGRFYPMHGLMPILNPAGFQAAVAQRQINDEYAHLNNRMDGAARYIGRKQNRLDILGPSVSQAARLTLEPHIKE